MGVGVGVGVGVGEYEAVGATDDGAGTSEVLWAGDGVDVAGNMEVDRGA